MGSPDRYVIRIASALGHLGRERALAGIKLRSRAPLVSHKSGPLRREADGSPGPPREQTRMREADGLRLLVDAGIPIRGRGPEPSPPPSDPIERLREAGIPIKPDEM